MSFATPIQASLATRSMAMTPSGLHKVFIKIDLC